MLKAGGSRQIQGVNIVVSVEVCQTFEHPSLLQNGDENLDFPNCVPAFLNRYAILLLSHLGVPGSMFTDMMAMELDKVRLVHRGSLLSSPIPAKLFSTSYLWFCLLDRKAAYRLVRKYYRTHASNLLPESFYSHDLNVDEEEGIGSQPEDSVFDLTQLTQSLFSDTRADEVDALPIAGQDYDASLLQLEGKFKSDAAHAFDFLEAGHALNEPYLSSLLRKLQMKSYKLLRKGNIKIRNAINLVGAPDPFDILQEGEVFISYPCDGLGGVQPNRDWNNNGDVVVLRSPTLHHGHIRKLRAVDFIFCYYVK